jgi:hypothetical protein
MVSGPSTRTTAHRRSSKARSPSFLSVPFGLAGSGASRRPRLSRGSAGAEGSRLRYRRRRRAMGTALDQGAARISEVGRLASERHARPRNRQALARARVPGACESRDRGAASDPAETHRGADAHRSAPSVRCRSAAAADPGPTRFGSDAGHRSAHGPRTAGASAPPRRRSAPRRRGRFGACSRLSLSWRPGASGSSFGDGVPSHRADWTRRLLLNGERNASRPISLSRQPRARRRPIRRSEGGSKRTKPHWQPRWKQRSSIRSRRRPRNQPAKRYRSNHWRRFGRREQLRIRRRTPQRPHRHATFRNHDNRLCRRNGSPQDRPSSSPVERSTAA